LNVIFFIRVTDILKYKNKFFIKVVKMKVLIVYDTKYGNTKKVGELIAEGINTADGNEITIESVKKFDVNKEEKYDLILIGSPNHAGSHTGSVKKFIKSLSNAPLKVGSYAAFDTYMSKDFEKAVNKIDKQISKIMPDLKKASPGLSIKVGGMKGPIVEEDLEKCKDYGISLTK
jgi:menaquinone-dependent protoporphyrinogen IX oxidase